MPLVTMILGYPSSGKTTLSEPLIEEGHIHLNRDTTGGRVADLVPVMERCLREGRNVVLDNLFPTVLSRAPFLVAAKKIGATVSCLWMQTSLEDSQINALHRMWRRYGRLFMSPADLHGVDDPNMFPVAVLFKYRKEFERPTMTEGFSEVIKVPFVRQHDPAYTNKAIILDYDGTLRTVKPHGHYKFPTRPSEVEILPNRSEVLERYKTAGYMLLGASNQSGIARAEVLWERVIDCFDYTNNLLAQNIDYVFCPHGVPPSCYCRKPQSGMGVLLINKHKLDPRQCFYVGDQTTDRTFAERLGFKFIDQAKFFI